MERLIFHILLGCLGLSHAFALASSQDVAREFREATKENSRTLGLLFRRCCEETEACTLVKALCQLLGITLENLKKLGEVQSQAERIQIEAFRNRLLSLGRNFDYIYNEKTILCANG